MRLCTVKQARVRELLDSYPRRRSPLTKAHERRYLLDYRQNREGCTAATSIAQRMERWMHRKVAAQGRKGDALLELGAGTLNHVRYEHGYVRYDFVEPFTELWQGSGRRGQLSDAYLDTFEIPEHVRYDRVLSIAVLEHLTELPAILARCGQLLNPEGLFQAGIPSEGGFLWGAAWRLATGIAYRMRTGLEYGTLMRHEHVNAADEIVLLARHFFSDVRIARFPTPLLHLSFYTYIEARHPALAACRDYLGRRE
ncbi:MAG: class I SAM-dependent methyltransferase [Acidobacteriota bacterium]|nr:class I SAM-dependent methyltransferase [Acidobacteriota bacterium]